MYRKTTDDITVSVDLTYSDDHSDPEEHTFVWLYRIAIENGRSRPVKLCNRFWRIVDETGHIEEISGPGVVGQQPVIPAGESFEYVSGAPLKTPSGMMGGYYSMMDLDGNLFTVDIPSFSLDSPYSAKIFH
ncbi:MAG: Co2+/Mg2+ efflux protein ApaG [Alphaproteobacteria bacterium]